MEIWIDIPGYEGMYQASKLYRNSQKSILDRFLFRRTGYSSERLKRNHFTFISKYGDCYRLVSVNE